MRDLKTTSRFAVAFVACFVWIAALAAPLSDGPYVVSGADGGLETWSVAAGQKRVEAVADNASITVPAVGVLPAFKVRLRPPAVNSPDTVKIPAKAPILVVADTHGEF